MKRSRLFALAAALVPLFFIAPWSPAHAQEDTFDLEYTEVFGKLSRPVVSFPHLLHEEALGWERCGACHHVYNEDTGELEHVEGDYTSCAECHGARKVGNTPALREAFHGNCTGCHREMRAGPVTCGECHIKR
jgi:hypothetical protein